MSITMNLIYQQQHIIVYIKKILTVENIYIYPPLILKLQMRIIVTIHNDINFIKHSSPVINASNPRPSRF